MSENMPVLDVPVNIDMDVDKAKLLLQLYQEAAKFNHGFSQPMQVPGAPPSQPSGKPYEFVGPPKPKSIPNNNHWEGRERDEKGRFVGGGQGEPGGQRAPSGKFNFAAFSGMALKIIMSPLKLLGGAATLLAGSFSLLGKAIGKTLQALKSIFVTAIKWTLGIAAIAGGGIFGYNHFAKAISNNYTESRGKGISSAFGMAMNTTFGSKISGAGDLAGNIADAKGDVQNPTFRALMNLGLDPNGDVEQNTKTVMRMFWQDARKNKGSMTGFNQSKLFYGQFGLGHDSYMQAADMDESEYARTGKMLTKQTKNNQLSKDTQQSYQETMMGLEGNLDSLGATFAKVLKDINPEIQNFSDSITNNLNKFMTENGQSLFTTVGDGLTSLTNYMNKPEFLDNIKKVGTEMGNLLIGIVDLVKWINKWIPESESDGSGTSWSTLAVGGALAMKFVPGVSTLAGAGARYAGSVAASGVLGSPVAMTVGGLIIPTNNTPNQSEEMKERDRLGTYNTIKNIAQDSKLPPGMIMGIADKESKFNRWADNGSHYGVGQFSKETGNYYGLFGDDFFDPEKSGRAMERYLLDLMKRYKGDIAKVLVAYNGGKIGKDGDTLSLNKESNGYLLTILPKIKGALEQHPNIMSQLRSASSTLSKSPKDAHVTIHLKNTPGSDIQAQVTSTSAFPAGQLVGGM